MYKIFNQSKHLANKSEMRKNLTPAEARIWLHLKNKKLGVKFRRQHAIGNYIADFYCKEKNLVIEIDGEQHAHNQKYDKERDRYFESLGIKVVRFWNGEVLKNIENVLISIYSLL